MPFENELKAVTSALLDITQPAMTAVVALKVAAENEIAAQVAKFSEAVKQLDAANQDLAKAYANLASLKEQLHAQRNILSGCGDMNLHCNWEVKPGKEDNIGAWTEGTQYALVQSTTPKSASTSMLFSITPAAGGWSDVLAAVHRRSVPVAARLWLEGQIKTSVSSLKGTQCIEIDTIVTKGSKKYNLSSQINYAKGGILQVAHPDGSWWDTPIVVGMLAPDVWHSFSWEYLIDTVAQSFSYIALTIDNKTYELPPQFQALTPIDSTWSDGIHLQLQIDANNKGIGFNVLYDRLNYYIGQP